jgi:predicted adenine nucleotide alpha hydrolase (AANH) superfamily ATPase
MGDRKPIGVAYRDQDIDGGEIGRNDPQLVRGTRLYATEELGYCSCAFGKSRSSQAKQPTSR